MERKGKARNGGGGFTLIELMLVVAILSVMVAIAIPKFGDMIARAHEASAKAHLGAIRGALRMEAASQEVNPEDLYLLGNGNSIMPPVLRPYFDTTDLPVIYFKHLGHPKGRTSGFGVPSIAGGLSESNFAGVGRYWLWGINPPSKIIINCSHRDFSGKIWSTW